MTRDRVAGTDRHASAATIGENDPHFGSPMQHEADVASPKVIRTSRTEPEYREMGDRLRAERRRRGLSLRELAGRLGVSPSMISQVETGRATPSVSTLYSIASELDVSLDELLFNGRRPGSARDVVGERADAADERSTAHGSRSGPARSEPVQGASTRKTIHLASGVTWDRLTTASEPGVDFLYVTYEVGGASSTADSFQRHPGHEWGHVLSGTLKVTIAFEEYLLQPGDSISFDSMVPHRLANAGSVPVHGIWFVLGRAPVHELSEHAREVARTVGRPR